MKNLMLFLVVLISTPSFAGNAPAAVKKSFEQKFPNATAIKWEKENAHEYEATFVSNGEKQSANFNDQGEWLETERSTTFDKLPDAVRQAFSNTHKGASVKAAAVIETSAGLTKYEVEVKKSLGTTEIFYNADGTELKK